MALKRKSGSKVTDMNTRQLEMLGKQYEEVSAQIKELEKTKKTLADAIKNGAEQSGVKDDKGSFYYETATHILGKVASKSISLNTEKAIEILKSKGGDCAKAVTPVTTEVVDEKALTSLYENGQITDEELQSMTNIKTTYKVSVTKKEEIVDVQQSTLAVAKKK